MKRITIRRPDDWHLHLRDGELLAAVLPHSAARFARAIVMPNLRPPVTTTAQALAYRDRIRAALPVGADFAPLMTLYLTDATPPEEIARARESGAVFGVKLYPSGATTNSDEGVTDIHKARPALAAMAECGLPLLVHGEVTDPAVDLFDREAVFIERGLAPLLDDLPDLRVVLEHVTTRQGVEFVMAAGDRVAATVTPQHMAMNRNELFRGGLRPHHYCLPVLKREEHREAVCAAATSGHPRLFLGSDSAPHPRGAKESACGCAGIYSAHAAIELYAEIFERVGALDRLEGFASLNGPHFHGLPPNEERLVLERTPWRVPEGYAAGDETIVPLRAGGEISWRIAAREEGGGASAS